MKKLLFILLFVYSNAMGFHRYNEVNILNIVMQLDLTQAQKKEIQTIIQNCRKSPLNRPNFLKESFVNGKFDKNKYILLKVKFMKKRIKKQAQIMDKIIKVLTPNQKKRLGEIIDRNFND